jgi:hypothetical protein
LDINEKFGFNKVTDKNSFEIEFETDPSKRPKEFAALDVVSNPDDNIPLPLRSKSTTTDPKENLFRAAAMKKSFRHMKKFKKFN